MDREDWDWAKKIAWSNLYKIAPENKNPNDFEKRVQLTMSVELIKKEIAEINPKYCIVLTNKKWWQPFQDRLGVVPLQIQDLPSKIEFFGEYNNTKIIVTTRPRFGNTEIYVNQILGLMNAK